MTPVDNLLADRTLILACDILLACDFRPAMWTPHEFLIRAEILFFF